MDYVQTYFGNSFYENTPNMIFFITKVNYPQTQKISAEKMKLAHVGIQKKKLKKKLKTKISYTSHILRKLNIERLEY